VIIEFIVWSLTSVVQLVLGILPNVPATPQPIIDGGAWVIDTIAGVISVLTMVYGQALLTAIVVVIVGILGFEQIYHTAMWVIRKIPFINVK